LTGQTEHPPERQAIAGTVGNLARLGQVGALPMLSDEQVAVLCDIGQSIAFADDRHGEVEKLIVEGYVTKDGDIFELTPKGEKILADRGAGLNEA
jgi:hypothetical protein